MNIHIDITGTKISTKRLMMRAWQAADLTDLFAYASEPGVFETAGRPHHKSIEDSKKLLESYIENSICFALYHLEDQKVIGSLELHGSWASKDPRFAHLAVTELGIIVGREYWGLGIAAEAALGAISHCFTVLQADAMTACHFLDNHQSRRVIEKCGFSFMQEDVYYSRYTNREYLEKQYILLRSEFDTGR